MMLPPGANRPMWMQVVANETWETPTRTIHAMRGIRLDESMHPTGEAWTFTDEDVARAYTYQNRHKQAEKEEKAARLAERLDMLPEDGSAVRLSSLSPSHFTTVVGAYQAMLSMYPHIHVLRASDGTLVVSRNLMSNP
jgi:hypothetical protein